MSRVVFDGLGVPGAAQGMSGKEQSTWTQVSGTRHKNCNVMRLFRHGNICPIVLEICVTMDFGGQYLAISRSILPVLVSCSKHQINLDDVVHALAYLLQCETTRIVISTNASDSWATQRAPESVGAHPCLQRDHHQRRPSYPSKVGALTQHELTGSSVTNVAEGRSPMPSI
jgi:hypothetical protein